MTEENTPRTALLMLSQQATGEAELRPSLLKTYAAETLDCYRRRFERYEEWCSASGLQPGAEHITSAKVLGYVEYQVGIFVTWCQAHSDGSDEELPAELLRPDTLQQAVNALVYYAERAGVPAPDDHEPKELVRSYRQVWQSAEIPRLYTVTGRRTHRRGRRGPAVENMT